MDNVLQTALAEAVNSLASFFGTTTEAIVERAPEFLAKYGWYSTLNGLGMDIFLAIVVASIIFLVASLILLMFDVELKHPMLGIISITVIIIVATIVVKLITCAVAPEIVGAHAVLELLKNAK